MRRIYSLSRFATAPPNRRSQTSSAPSGHLPLGKEKAIILNTPYFPISYVHEFSCGEAKERRKPSFPSLFWILSSFLCIVRRFFSKSDTDIGLLPGYDCVDICVFRTADFLFREPKGFRRSRRTPRGAAPAWYSPGSGSASARSSGTRLTHRSAAPPRYSPPQYRRWHTPG